MMLTVKMFLSGVSSDDDKWLMRIYDDIIFLWNVMTNSISPNSVEDVGLGNCNCLNIDKC